MLRIYFTCLHETQTCNIANSRPQHTCVEYPSIGAETLLANEELSCRKHSPTYTSIVCVPELGHYVIESTETPANQQLPHSPLPDPTVILHLKGKSANKDAGQEDRILPENGTSIGSVIEYLESY